MHDAALLRRYAEDGSESAFAELVRRCLPLVYGAALRRVGGDVHLAEDVSQSVFTAIARDAARLARHPDLAGWLFTTTRFLAAKSVRTERRRQFREQMAALDPTQTAGRESETATERLRPVLDEVMMELRELDRQMLLMRFYRGLRLADIAAQINSTDNAVQKRIERALEHLNAAFSRRGITSTASALAFALEQHAAVAVPAGLAAASTTAGLACGSGGVGALAASAGASAAKLPLYAAMAVVVISSAGLGWYYRENARLRAQLAGIAAAPPRAKSSAQERPRSSVAPRVTPGASAPVAEPQIPAAVPVQNPAMAATAPVTQAPSRRLAVGKNEPRVPLKIDYPRPLFAGTPRPLVVPNLEPATARPVTLMVPAPTVLLSRRRPVTSSDPLPVIGELSFITDGDKTGTDGTYVELGPGLQWIQIDLGEPAVVHAVAVWHFHSQARVYHDVVVQVADDATFARGVTTLFNNDHDNTAKLGKGSDTAYIETFRGRVIDGHAAPGRFVRLYSNGNTSDELNHYCEVEVFGQFGEAVKR